MSGSWRRSEAGAILRPLTTKASCYDCNSHHLFTTYWKSKDRRALNILGLPRILLSWSGVTWHVNTWAPLNMKNGVCPPVHVYWHELFLASLICCSGMILHVHTVFFQKMGRGRSVGKCPALALHRNVPVEVHLCCHLGAFEGIIDAGCTWICCVILRCPLTDRLILFTPSSPTALDFPPPVLWIASQNLGTC